MFAIKTLKSFSKPITCSCSKALPGLYQSNRFSTTKNDDANIPRPQHSTTAAGLGKKFSDKEVEKLLDPMGFIKEDEAKLYEGLDDKGNLKDFKKALEEKPKEKKYDYESHNVKPHVKEMKEEYGFKAKGPEPTRYGDWEKKGRVTDF